MKAGQILVLFTRINYPLRPGFYDKYFFSLPRFLQNKIGAYLKLKDRVASILGKQLLLNGLGKLGYSCEYLESLQYTSNNRPFLSLLPNVDFNISHSGLIVLCAISTETRIGVDIEEQTKVNISGFKDQFSPDQWEEIENSPDPEELFYQYWVQKESIVKADHLLTLTPFPEIHIEYNRATINKKVWHLTKLDIHKSYCSWLATNVLRDVIIHEAYF